jgi:hypothetical protein
MGPLMVVFRSAKERERDWIIEGFTRMDRQTQRSFAERKTTIQSLFFFE